MRPSPPLVTVLVVLLGLLAIVAGWLAARAGQERLTAQARALQASEPAARLAALQRLQFDGSDDLAELILRRITDTDQYVRGTAMERAYRLDLGNRLDTRHLPTVMDSAQHDLERPRRWALALLTAHSLDAGFGETLRAWPSLHSPYSRPFLVAVLAREAERSGDSLRRLDALAAKSPAGATLVRAVRTALRLPAPDRYPCPFPPELRLDPEPLTRTHHSPSPAPVIPLPTT